MSTETVKKQQSKGLVLVVDDDVRILKFIRTSLKLAGYSVITATGGEEALHIVATEQPDVMLLDILMSPMDGFEVLTKLRPMSDLPVIAVSAHSTVGEKALSLGATEFIGKPFRPDALIQRIGVHLEKAR